MKKRRSEQLPRHKSLRTALRILILILFSLFLFSALNQNPWSGCAVPRYEGTYQYEEPCWTYRQGDTLLESELHLPAFRKMETGESYSISAVLTYDGSEDEDPAGFYYVDHMFTRVFLDGNLIFSYMPEDIQKSDRAESPGNVYASFQLPHDCRGRELVIEFTPALSDGIDYQLPNPSFGDCATEFANMFREDLPHNVILLLSMALGIASILYSTLALSGSNYREGVFIGIFATLFSLYSLTESDFDFYMISNPYYTYLLDYITFTLIPIFFMAFLRERLEPKQQKISLVLIGIGVVLFLTEMLLHFTGVMDMREFLPVIHGVYLIDFLIIIALIATMKKNRWKTQLILQMVPMLLGMLMDVTAYYNHWHISSSDSGFTAFGVIVFLIAELYHVWRHSIEVYAESLRSRDYHQMAYIDSLTGIGNRRAFDAEKDAVTSGKQKKPDVIVSADLNNLKQTNDNFGHAAGDFLIRSAANVLTDFSEGYGHAFRIGGDEFVAAFYQITPDEFENRLSRLYSQTDAINSESNVLFSLAVGYEFCENMDPETALQSADRKMYVNKAAMKAKIADKNSR